jgi:hypothetical protein
LRLCPAYPGNPRDNIEGESPLQRKGHTVFETGATEDCVSRKRMRLRPPQDEADKDRTPILSILLARYAVVRLACAPP